MSTTLILGIVSGILGLILLICFYILYQQSKNKKAIKGNRLTLIYKSGGDADFLLLPLDGSRLVQRSKEGYEMPYMVRPDKGYNIMWPLGKAGIFQVPVKMFSYAEGSAEPIDPFDRPPIINNEVLGALQDRNMSRAMVGRGEEIVERMGAPQKKKIGGKWLWIAIGVAIVIIIVIMVVTQGGAGFKIPGLGP